MIMQLSQFIYSSVCEFWIDLHVAPTMKQILCNLLLGKVNPKRQAKFSTKNTTVGDTAVQVLVYLAQYHINSMVRFLGQYNQQPRVGTPKCSCPQFLHSGWFSWLNYSTKCGKVKDHSETHPRPPLPESNGFGLRKHWLSSSDIFWLEKKLTLLSDFGN